MQESLFHLKIRVGLTIEPVRLWVLTIVTLSSVNSSTFLKSYLLFRENQLIVAFSRLKINTVRIILSFLDLIPDVSACFMKLQMFTNSKHSCLCIYDYEWNVNKKLRRKSFQASSWKASEKKNKHQARILSQQDPGSITNK